MKWATFETRAETGVSRVGVVDGAALIALPPGSRLIDLIADGQASLQAVGEKLITERREVHDLETVRLFPPIPRPPSIRDFASFHEHISVSMRNIGASFNDNWFEAPTFYFTSPNNLFGDGDTVRVHGDTTQMDYELEVCAIIGRGGMDIPPEQALEHVAGYAIFNDWSARDLQATEMRRLPIGPGKGKDCATSIGPYLVTPDELEDRKTDTGFDLKMVASVNGVEYGSGNWSSIYWSFAEAIAFASRSSPLVPGDVIGSGTVGTGCILEQAGTFGAEKYPWLKEGDVVELEVERLGVLRNRVKWNKPPVPFRAAGRVSR